MDRRDAEVPDAVKREPVKLDMTKLLGFEHLDLPDGGQAETIVAEALNKRGEGPVQVSDRRLKTDVTMVGRTESGLPLYDFLYIGNDNVFRGVMAQDLLADARFADAVETRGGFHLVDYAKIGLGHLATPAMRKAGMTALGEAPQRG